MSRVLHLDFETFSDLDLRTVGLYRYVTSPEFQVTVIAWAFDNDPVKALVWPNVSALPDEIMAHINSGGKIHAWNAAFEWNVIDKGYNVSIAHEAMVCTMQRALAWGLPAALGDAGPALGLTIVKDKTQTALVRVMGKPSPDGSKRYENDPLGLVSLMAYCRQDVEAERALSHRLPHLNPWEQRLSWLDARINEKGVMIDTVAVQNLMHAARHEETSLKAEAALLTNGAVTSPGTQAARLVAWMVDRGFIIGGATKEAVDRALKMRLDDVARRVLEIRQLSAKSSTRKLDKMIEVLARDRRARNQFQFYGAGRTGRWAGRLIQIQNLPRGSAEFPAATVIKIVDKDFRALGMFFKSPLAAIAGALRGCLVAPSGMGLVSIDFSQIEARVLAWLAGQQDIVKAFATGLDVYVLAAAKVGSQDRQLGKVLTLACGYGMGADRFRETAATYGVVLTVMEAQSLVDAWRNGNRAIKQFWWNVDAVVRDCLMAPGTVFTLGALKFRLGLDGVLQIRKPSGSKLSYHRFRGVWNAGHEDLVYDGVMQMTHQWGEVRTYGGKLVENIVQSVARDVMAEAMLRVEDELHLVPVMTVHDEIVWEMMEGAYLVDLKALVDTPPAWAAGLPIASDMRLGRRYSKA